MEENNLNIPPTEEPIARRISRIASQLMPLLLPASTFFIGKWLPIYEIILNKVCFFLKILIKDFVQDLEIYYNGSNTSSDYVGENQQQFYSCQV